MNNIEIEFKSVAIVIPAYKVKKHIIQVIQKSLPNAGIVIVVDDACPEQTGSYVESHFTQNDQVLVMKNQQNLGVGGAVKAGWLRALQLGYNYMVKIDGDGQMDPDLVPNLIFPLVKGYADYAKGNRFQTFDVVNKMPTNRLIGNSVLSFFSKVSSGYWNISDPTNGFVAISSTLLSLLSLDKIHNRYFFESDILFRIGLEAATIYELPMKAHYADEVSSLNIKKTIVEFTYLHINRTIKRIIYNYILRDFNAGSIQLIFGVLLSGFGTIFGAYKWYLAANTGITTPLGTIMLATLPTILGFQLILGWLNYDITQSLSLKYRPLSKR